MTKTITGDLILEKNTTFDESIIVEGNIYGKRGEWFNLTVRGNITAGNIITWDINAWDITARNINAGDIIARNINAWDINYYAVCFAYEHITCKSIKGRRENARHFCLDGKITIKEASG